MARPLRLEFAGVLYHVMSRGNRPEMIYESDDDRRAWLSIFDEVCEIFNWVCHAYCLIEKLKVSERIFIADSDS